jgi:hypothetical protein
MKKFGTPMRAAPGTASENVGLLAAGEPSGLLSRGAGRATGGDDVFGDVGFEQSRPELEVECEELEQGRVVPVPPFCAFAPLPLPDALPPVDPAWLPGVAVAAAPGVAVDVADGDAPGVAVADSVGAGVAATVVSTGEATGDGEAVLDGVAAGAVAVAVCVGAAVSTGALVGAGAAELVAAGVASGEPAGAGSWAVASVPSVAA